MRILLHRNHMTASVSTLGAQLRSLRRDGTEFIWPGDEKLWADSCLTLFPFIGRCAENAYLLQGKRYEMGLHGFAHKTDFTVESQSETRCTLKMTDTQETRACYPFPFVFRVTYALEDTGILVEYQVENTGTDPMHFSLGGHPGFLLDLQNHKLTDYYVEFEEDAAPVQQEIVTLCMRTGAQIPVSLDGHRLWITPELFASSALVLSEAGSSVTLGCREQGPILTLDKQEFPYLTLWQTLRSGAPFLCLEPWSSMPGRQDCPEEITRRQDLLLLPPRQQETRCWSVRLSI